MRSSSCTSDPGDDRLAGEGDLVSCDACGSERRAESDADAEEVLCEFCRGEGKCLTCGARAGIRVEDDAYCITHGVATLSEDGLKCEFPAQWDDDGNLRSDVAPGETARAILARRAERKGGH